MLHCKKNLLKLVALIFFKFAQLFIFYSIEKKKKIWANLKSLSLSWELKVEQT